VPLDGERTQYPAKKKQTPTMIAVICFDASPVERTIVAAARLHVSCELNLVDIIIRPCL
jgi:hypothetical protein